MSRHFSGAAKKDKLVATKFLSRQKTLVSRQLLSSLAKPCRDKIFYVAKKQSIRPKFFGIHNSSFEVQPNI